MVSKKSLEGLNMFNSANLTLSFDVDQHTYRKVTKTQENTTHKKAKRSASHKFEYPDSLSQPTFVKHSSHAPISVHCGLLLIELDVDIQPVSIVSIYVEYIFPFISIG